MVVETKPENAAPAVYRLPIDPTAEHAASASSRAEVDRVLLRRNAVWFCGLRWIVVGLLLVAAGAACFPSLLSALGVRLDYSWPLATAVALGVLNSVYVLLMPSEHARLAQVRLHLWVQIIADLVILTVVVHFLGSVETAAPFMYLFHIILACVFFPPSQSLAVAATAVLLYCGCLALESAGVVRPATIVQSLPLQTWDRDFLSGRFWSLHMGPLLAIWGVIWYVASRLSGALRKREAELAITNVRLKASSEERTRHMLQTTHELKAPFAAIHANAQILLSGTCGSLPDEAKSLVERIAARCTMLSQQILDMLQLSNLHSESQETLSPLPMDLAESLRGCIARVQPAAGLRGISIKAELEPVTIAAVEDHLRMLFDNLLTNAVHYSHDGGCCGSDLPAAGGRDGPSGDPGPRHWHPGGETTAYFRGILPHPRGGAAQQGIDRAGAGDRPRRGADGRHPSSGREPFVVGDPRYLDHSHGTSRSEQDIMAYLLIVDDDVDFSAAVATVLGGEGYETSIEDHPEGAMSSLKKRLPDAVVLDVMFPENPTAGFDLARTIRRTYKDLPILMLTAVNQQFPLGFSNRDIDKRWLPVADFVEKPVDFRLLCDKVAHLLAPAPK